MREKPLSSEAQQYFDDLRVRRMLAAAERPAIVAEGTEALKRLIDLAQGDSGQSGVVARFVLGLYNGQRFPFDLTDFRRLDDDLYLDCMRVLRMDARITDREVHAYFDEGGQLFERIARLWCRGGSAADE